jgi:hypothetical protein
VILRLTPTDDDESYAGERAGREQDLVMGDGRISDTQLCTDPRNALAGRIATTQPITLPNFAEAAGKTL